MTRSVADAQASAVAPAPRLPSLADPPLVLDGGMGTALAAAGLPDQALPEEWLLSRPDDVSAVHRAHAAAGARVLLTCTFNTASPRLASRGLAERCGAICERAVEIARAAGAGALVAGDVGPAGLAHPGEPRPPPHALEEAYARPFRALAEAGADLLWAETQWDLGEAHAALAAARRFGLPAVVTMTFVRAGEILVTPAGDPAAPALRALARDGAAAVGVNCTFADAPLAELVGRLAPALGVPVIAKPSPGLPGAVADPESFAESVVVLARAGARLVGGCCGATAAHVAAVARRLERQI